MRNILLTICLILVFAINANATTWFLKEHTCPICQQKNDYNEIGSYGTYIYQWDTKFQYFYWPLTDWQSVYSCPKCHFSCFMWDFDNIPENKIDTIGTYLSGLKLDTGISNQFKGINSLEIAEGVYKILERNQEFWCRFYRVLGYHYDEEGNQTKAKDNRLKSLDIAKTMLNDSLNSGQEKELMYIIAAMYNFTGEPDTAKQFLEKAKLMKYSNSELNADEANGMDNYLSDLINQYIDLIDKKKNK